MMNTRNELNDYYKSLSNIQLIEIYIKNGLLDQAQSLLIHQLSQRGLNPTDLNEEYLNDLLKKSGYSEGIKALSFRYPISEIIRFPLYKTLEIMNRLKVFATNHPYLFSLIIVMIHPIIKIAYFVTYDLIIGMNFHEIKTNILKQIEVGNYYCGFASFFVFSFILWRFGWFRASGFLSFGKWKIWAIMVPILLYDISITHIIISGTFEFGIVDKYKIYFPVSSILLAHFFIAALFEETIFRGIIFYTFLRLWGNSKPGILKSVIISSAIFGMLHIDGSLSGIGDILGVLFKVLWTFIAGIFFCVLLLNGKSIWIPVTGHCLYNVILDIIINRTNLSITPYSHFLIFLTAIPIGLFGIYLLRKNPTRPIVPDAA